MRRSIVCLTVVASWSTLYLAAQQRPTDTFRSGRDVLTIDTSVRDAGGRPITDLAPADFAVRIDGQPRAVLTARMFGTDAGRITNDVEPAPRFTQVTDASPGRVVVFAIDRTSIRAGGEKAAIDTAAAMLDALSPADAVGAAGLPGGGIELTRDHAAVAGVIRQMSGTAPSSGEGWTMSWADALDAEKRCDQIPDPCPREFEIPLREFLRTGRAHAQEILASLSALLDRLGPLRAPKHLVLISGGIPFDLELLSRYQALAGTAARNHVALFVVHLDQVEFDATDTGVSKINSSGHGASVFGGREYATGLGNIASSTGGEFLMGVGRATGAFQRIASDINYFYQLGVESRPSDNDGKTHRVEVKVGRAGARVRAPAETVAPRRAQNGSSDDAIKRALEEPTDTAELPLEVATYLTHSSEPEKVRVIVASQLAEGTGLTPTDWGYAISDGGRVVAGSRIRVSAGAAGPWSATASVDVPPGRYRLRTAVVSADGRIGVLDEPLRVGLRSAGSVQASDLIVGTAEQGRIEPRARVRQDERAIGMIEISSAQPLAEITGILEMTRGGTAQPAWRGPLALRTRADDKSIVVAESAPNLSSLTPGTYTASAILLRAGTPFSRVSRVIEVMPGSGTAAPVETARAKGPAPRDPAVDDVMERVGRYVAGYGQQASLIIGVEHYEQQIVDPIPGETARRRLVSEFALVRTADAIGWSGFRDVVEVDGRRQGGRENRLQRLFSGGTATTGEARGIANESARFNLGPTRRNFNEPMSMLLFLMPQTQSRFDFARKRETTVAGIKVWEIGFRETARPTMIRTADGLDVPSEGTIWVDPSDGTVVRTRLDLAGFAGRASTSTVDVTFARDSRLDLWLPATMKERLDGAVEVAVESSRRMSGIRQATVTGFATYGDFKRFQTSATIK